MPYSTIIHAALAWAASLVFKLTQQRRTDTNLDNPKTSRRHMTLLLHIAIEFWYVSINEKKRSNKLVKDLYPRRSRKYSRDIFVRMIQNSDNQFSDNRLYNPLYYTQPSFTS